MPLLPVQTQAIWRTRRRRICGGGGPHVATRPDADHLADRRKIWLFWALGVDKDEGCHVDDVGNPLNSSLFRGAGCRSGLLHYMPQ